MVVVGIKLSQLFIFQENPTNTRKSGNSHGVVEETCFLFLERSAEWLLERHHLKPFLLQP